MGRRPASTRKKVGKKEEREQNKKEGRRGPDRGWVGNGEWQDNRRTEERGGRRKKNEGQRWRVAAKTV